MPYGSSDSNEARASFSAGRGPASGATDWRAEHPTSAARTRGLAVERSRCDVRPLRRRAGGRGPRPLELAPAVGTAPLEDQGAVTSFETRQTPAELGADERVVGLGFRRAFPASHACLRVGHGGSYSVWARPHANKVTRGSTATTIAEVLRTRRGDRCLRPRRRRSARRRAANGDRLGRRDRSQRCAVRRAENGDPGDELAIAIVRLAAGHEGAGDK